mmetsp:Transcript_58202/g.103323  ORF Transcript_58202/g.103323 Transcript_58202/m.103323 type:complete len:418 (+) Transcript_58202:124-1377(+)
MGISSCSVQRCEHRFAYSCPGDTSNCSSKEIYDLWVTHELSAAMVVQDMAKIEHILGSYPALKERELTFPGEAAPLTALQFALNRGDEKVTRALLIAGVSPNLPLTQAQRVNSRAYVTSIDPLGEDEELHRLPILTHFEATCVSTQKELFMVLLEYGANPNNGIVHVSYLGDVEMLEALLDRSANPNKWQGVSATPLIIAVKSKLQAHEKVVSLLRRSADPNFVGQDIPTARIAYPALSIATQRRDYRMVRILLEGGADPNQISRDEGLPNALFWATYWGEIEIIKLFMSFSKHKLDLHVRKYTQETVFDVARTASAFSKVKKPRHIAKLPLPARSPVVYERIVTLFEEYQASHSDGGSGSMGAASARPDSLGASTTATSRTDAVYSTDRADERMRESSGPTTPRGPYTPPRGNRDA